MPTQDDWDAIRLLNAAHDELDEDTQMSDATSFSGHIILVDAIKHLARSDRAVYPKTRRGIKRHPIVRKRYDYDDAT